MDPGFALRVAILIRSIFQSSIHDSISFVLGKNRNANCNNSDGDNGDHGTNVGDCKAEKKLKTLVMKVA